MSMYRVLCKLAGLVLAESQNYLLHYKHLYLNRWLH